MYLGIDIGSSSSKAALINDDFELASVKIINTGTGTLGVDEAIEAVLVEANVTRKEVDYVVVTGYGRITYDKADKQITEISCHAKGADYLLTDVDTVIDIGGQDAKVIKLLKNGKVENFVMNEKCAAGTGRFLEVMARVLNTNLSELSNLADKSKKNVPISSVCTVFAESEVISNLAAGENIADVARGANMAIAKRVAGMCKRVGMGKNIVMTGGVALNKNMVQAMSEVIGQKVLVAPYCQAVGAIGAAVYAYEKMHD